MALGRIERGTVVVLLVDFLAVMGVMTGGLLYAHIQPIFLALLSAVTFALFLFVWILMTRSTSS
jgi:hypothetical protein